MTRILVIVLMMLVTSVACFAADQKPDGSKGEGEWGLNGSAVVNAYNIGLASWDSTLYIIGTVRNLSGLPIESVIVTVGRRDADNTVVTYGTEELHLELLPTEAWRWHVKTDDFLLGHHRPYRLLGITVDGHKLAPM